MGWMVGVNVIVGATKVAGVLVTLSLAANAFSFSRFRRKYLRPFPSPLFDHLDTPHTLAAFWSQSHQGREEEEIEEDGDERGSKGKGFFFGLATAPAHVEDRLDDAWLHFAEELPGDHQSHPQQRQQCQQCRPPPSAHTTLESRGKRPVKIAMEAMIRGFQNYIVMDTPDQTSLPQCRHPNPNPNVAAWHNVPHPEERLRFWSDPDTELKLAKQTGISVFRMGIDWTRIMPKEPVNGLQNSVNFAALERYKWIINRVRSYGMKVMLTLFHHSLPPWAGEYGGWKSEKTVDYFLHFTRLVVGAVADMIDYWITFNEPHVFCLLTYCAGAWPGGDPDMVEVATSALPTGVFKQAMKWMAIAHSKAYDYIHEQRNISSNSVVGVAHHVSFMRPYGLFDVAAVTLANSLTLFPYVDSISEKLDFIGMNYYGQEVVSGSGLKLVDNDEYSESGRGVYPDGLYHMLLEFHERYKHLNVPFIITENGVSDETDLIRRPYIIEHLLAVYAAMVKGVPVIGYLFWTVSDNWEWADGYGPKFGLVAVDRANDLARMPRPSYHLFSKVATSGKITSVDRAHAWDELQRAAKEKIRRPFFRAVNKHGLMYAGGLDVPILRPLSDRDWRFGHYEMEGPQDLLSRFLRSFISPFSRKSKIRPQTDELVLQPLQS